jgi:hypothetical protein
MAAATSVLNTRTKQGGPLPGGCLGFLGQQPVNKMSTGRDPVSFHVHLHLGGNFRHPGMNSVQFLRLALDTASESLNEKSKKLKFDHEALLKAAGTRFEVLARKCHGQSQQFHSQLARSDSLSSFGESVSAFSDAWY